VLICSVIACTTHEDLPAAGTHDASGAGAAGSVTAAGKGGVSGSAGRGGASAAGKGGALAQSCGGSADGRGCNAAGSSGGGGAGVTSGAGGMAGSNATSDALPILPAPVMPGDPGTADVMLDVHTDQPLHLISDLIYGTNSSADAANTRQTVMRAGGNRWTAYNWETNASNAGSDYMFQNDNFLSSSHDPAAPVLDLITQATAANAAAIITIPIVDYVAGDANGGGDVHATGSDYLTKRFKQNKADKGSAVAATPDVGDGAVYQDELVSYLKAHAPSGSRTLFSLDNEPDLWSSTHAEVHPDPVTYAELWERNQRFATTIKRVWTDAKVLGFVSYGFNGLVTLQSASDASGRDFVDFYLDQAKAAEQSAGKRLIDYLDFHWYPEAQGGGVRVTEQNNSADVVAAREQAPRSLWDMGYVENSWIANDYLKGPVYILSRLTKQIGDHYPDTKLAITEWNYGGGNHISGTIASADVLGVFGREHIDLATFWPLAMDESFTYAAFRAFRNYDGAGATFGDVSVPATTSDVSSVTVYASLHSSATDDVVLIAINKATSDKSVALRLAHPTTFAKLSSYRVAGASTEIAKQADQTSTAKNAWKLTLPAQSVSVLVPRP
jgi:hypothetical protein